MCVCTYPDLEVQYEPSGLDHPALLLSKKKKTAVNDSAGHATNVGTEFNQMRCSFREVTSRINLESTLPSHESVAFCLQFLVFLVSVLFCQQEMTVKVKEQSMVIPVLLSNKDTVLNKPLHCFPLETGSLQYTRKTPYFTSTVAITSCSSPHASDIRSFFAEHYVQNRH